MGLRPLDSVPRLANSYPDETRHSSRIEEFVVPIATFQDRPRGAVRNRGATPLGDWDAVQQIALHRHSSRHDKGCTFPSLLCLRDAGSERSASYPTRRQKTRAMHTPDRRI